MKTRWCRYFFTSHLALLTSGSGEISCRTWYLQLHFNTPQSIKVELPRRTGCNMECWPSLTRMTKNSPAASRICSVCPVRNRALCVRTERAVRSFESLTEYAFLVLPRHFRDTVSVTTAPRGEYSFPRWIGSSWLPSRTPIFRIHWPPENGQD